MEPATQNPDPTFLPPGYRGSRGQVLLEVKRADGGITAREVADRLAMSLNAVRHHLKELEDQGILAWRRERRGIGAPVHLFQLTAEGDRLFPQRGDALLTDTLSRLEDRVGRPMIVGAMRDRYQALTDRLRDELADSPGPERLERVARVLADEGYMAAWDRTGGEVRLTEHHCAIRAVAERFPEICELEERFLREVLAADVERRSHILAGCHACEYSIHFPEQGPDGDPAPLGITRTGEK